MLRTWSEFEMLWKKVGRLLLLFAGILHLGVESTPNNNTTAMLLIFQLI